MSDSRSALSAHELTARRLTEAKALLDDVARDDLSVSIKGDAGDVSYSVAKLLKDIKERGEILARLT